MDTISSISTLTLTVNTGTPNRTGAGIAVNAPIYLFGTVALLDPATGALDPATQIAASQTRDTTWSDTNFGIVSALHEGDPLLFYRPNPTASGVLNFMDGYYAAF